MNSKLPLMFPLRVQNVKDNDAPASMEFVAAEVTRLKYPSLLIRPTEEVRAFSRRLLLFYGGELSVDHNFAADYRFGMNVVLPRNLEDYVAELVQTSGYKGSDEVVLEALREHQSRRQGGEVVMTPELERLLDEGLENLDQARSTDALRQRS
ncbi:MAG: hypothetical protein ABJC04_12675 [Verrucomicrobiota bacterium]